MEKEKKTPSLLLPLHQIIFTFQLVFRRPRTKRMARNVRALYPRTFLLVCQKSRGRCHARHLRHMGAHVTMPYECAQSSQRGEGEKRYFRPAFDTKLLTLLECGSTLPLPRVESAVPSKTASDETLRGSGHKSQDHVGRMCPQESPGAGALLRPASFWTRKKLTQTKEGGLGTPPLFKTSLLTCRNP